MHGIHMPSTRGGPTWLGRQPGLALKWLTELVATCPHILLGLWPRSGANTFGPKAQVLCIILALVEPLPSPRVELQGSPRQHGGKALGL